MTCEYTCPQDHVIPSLAPAVSMLVSYDPLSLPCSQHGSLAGTLSGHSSWVLSVAYCPDNQHFVTG